MAKKKTPSNAGTSAVETNTFSKGMQKDIYAGLNPKEQWGHARNAANNSTDGDIGIIGNEPANLNCANIPYTIIGAIHRYGDQWVIFSTNDISSEIGLFDDSKCEYNTLVNDDCLAFDRRYLITGAAKENYDCTWQVYWDDGSNPSRTLNIDDIPYIQTITSDPGADCVIYEDTDKLDCEKIRLSPLIEIPCVKLTKSVDGGQLRNGSYQAYIAYTLNEQRVSDYVGQSNIQALFEHDINGGSLDIELSNLDTEFEFYELVIYADNQGTKVATRMGLYSTEQTKISVDIIDNSLPTVSEVDLFTKQPRYERSKSMYVVNDYLIRQGPTEQFDFNYQPLANNITAQWVVADYDASYYYKGGNKTQFMRDEVYAFFIRWIYNTGEKSNSYHIPGRAPNAFGENQFQSTVNELGLNSGPHVISDSGQEYNFQVYNTAKITQSNLNIPTSDGEGTIIAKGDMAYWQSTEKYPATDPVRWADLCGKNIRHHKFPTEETHPSLALSTANGSTIRILGVEFSGIERPTNNDGTYIQNIIGYEILRGTRQGNKSILAKGLFRNMREYEIPETDGEKGLYPNYPYNDLRPDVYLHDGDITSPSSLFPNSNIVSAATAIWGVDPMPKTSGCDEWSDSLSNFKPVSGYKRDIFTFHSPELMFRRPFLNPYEIRMYGALGGISEGHFIKSEKHPQNKLIRNAAAIIAAIFGIGYAIGQMQGTQRTRKDNAKNLNTPWQPMFFGPAGTNAPGFNAVAYGFQSGGMGVSIGLNAALDILLDEGAKLADVMGGGGTVSSLAQLVQGNIEAGLGLMPGMTPGQYEREYVIDGDAGLLPILLKLTTGFINSGTQIAIGAQKVIDLLYNLVSFEDFAYKHNSHGLFDKYYKTNDGDPFRSRNQLGNYIGSVLQNFNPNSTDPANNIVTEQYRINNLFRPSTVAIKSSKLMPIPEDLGAPIDKSRYCAGGDADGAFSDSYITNPRVLQYKDISALYGALKFNFENQYGQLDGVKQVEMPECVYLIDPERPDKYLYSTDAIFSGDTYVGRYTEKVILPLFSDFLYGQPDQYPYNYLQRVNLPYPRFWMDTRKYDTSQFSNLFGTLATSFFSGQGIASLLPNDLFYLDRGSGNCNSGLFSLFSNKGGNSAFAMKVGLMYTHVNGIIDFFVESEVLLPNRDWNNTPAGRYYDNFRYEQYDDLFDAEIVREDNNFKYDYSLSASRFITNLTGGAANIQARDYDPLIAETCFVEWPKRLLYSLQAKQEAKKDFWRVFLPLNYKDFKNPVNVIKPINKNGAIIFFPYQSPQMFQGVDNLETDLGTKITIGDGGLFKQPFQNLVNSELPNEFGSCESQRGVINTPYGFFFISQAQGKVFQQEGQSLNPISNMGMKWWFNKFLPSSLVKAFPELENSELSDNPVVGVGCQVTFDISDDILYVCKRDFKVKEKYDGIVVYDSELDAFVRRPILIDPVDAAEETPIDEGIKEPIQVEIGPRNRTITIPNEGLVQPNQQIIVKPIDTTRPPVGNGNEIIEIGDPLYFDDCSWTVSYDPKAKAWISFHDWHPELCLSSINHFLTTKTQETESPQCPPHTTFNPETGKCESLIDVTEPAVVTIDEIALSSADACPEGYTYNPATNLCEDIQTAPIICSGTIYNVVKAATSPAYGQYGTRFYENATGRPLPINMVNIGSGKVLLDASGNELLVDTELPFTGTPQADFWKDRLNEIGVWASAGGAPIGEWIGFTACVEVPQTGTYSVLIAADNDTRFRLNGDVVVSLQLSYVENFRWMHVIPLTLTQGTHVISLEGYNSGSIAAFGAEIYYADVNYLSQISTNNQLSQVTVFSTLDKIGQNFDIGETSGCQCPEGFVLANCNGQLECVSISTTDPECACPDGYTMIFYDKEESRYTLPSGDCYNEPLPICRKVECECSEENVDPNAIITQTGECDDIYLSGPTGDLTYLNPNPLTCNFKLLTQLDPNYKVGGLWRHNYRCDLFSNYYGIDYPWEVEIIENTGQNVMTIRSLEYQLESYVYKGDSFNGCGDDRWHDLDFNFDESIIYNTEQVSGLLKLELNPKEDPINALSYPIINPNDIRIMYSKVEQKYRFNQFWDITNDRGEFTNAEQEIISTQCNGYIRDLNVNNLNYQKDETQRKKFRHYYNKVILRRTLSDNRKMLLKLNNTKLNLSFR